MKLVIMRHGEAGFSSTNGLDSGRELTARGQEQATHAASLLQDQYIQVQQVWASHYARAWQTGCIVAQHLNVPCQEERALSISGYDLQELAQNIAIFAKDQPVNAALVLVSHIPNVSDIMHFYAPNARSFSFYPANFVIVDLEQKRVCADSKQ
ncbi:SixA phosphatase family protein [Psittacicella hinzii]|uniref:Phosphohistidine phosphatase SixA n=1 Tax=Psittacicella hinzii TaxID=2028575 RepID=A0A3A1YDC7_9GAMM|nr:histidine phosphatase family protein [Psittacicella hinzii]RIY36162.1 hypothetical protein CKF58_06215 [Psittacicella hinzii]